MSKLVYTNTEYLPCFASPVPQFTESPGLTVDMTGKSPVDFFNLFFSTEVKDVIHTETCRYADQQLHANAEFLQTHPHARGHDWHRKPMKRNEIVPFLATIIAMGVVGFPTIR